MLVLLKLRVQVDGLHQFKRADHTVHRRAQFVGQGREEFILELVAAGQLLVEHFEFLAGIEQRLRLLFAHRVDAIGQCQRQQRHFDGRADLAGVHGQEHVRQQAQHHQRVDHATEQKRRPGDDEVARHPQAAAPGQNPGGENHHGEGQRQRCCQAQGQGVTGHQRQTNHQRTECDQGDQQAVKPAAVRPGLQKAAGELAAEQPRATDEERGGGVGPPRIVRPEILDRRAIHRQLIEPERGNVEDVIEVTGVSHAQVDEQVVDHHPQQHAINDAQHVQAHRLVFEIRSARPQSHRRLDRTFAGETQVHGLLLIRRERQVEQIVVLADLTTGERQGIAGLPDQVKVAMAVGQIQVEMVERRICQLQQPGALGARIARAVMQVDLQPECRA